MAFVYTYNGETDYNDDETTGGFQVQNFGYGGRITFSASGTINQLGSYSRTAGGTIGHKIVLYDTSGNLVADGGSLSLSATSLQWNDVATFTPVAVSATDYIVMYSSESDAGRYGLNTSNDGSDCTEGYATFPADPETLELEAETDEGMGGRANFTASGGARPQGPLGHVFQGPFAGPIG